MKRSVFLTILLILGLDAGLKASDEYGFLDLVSKQELQRKHVQSASYTVPQDFLDSQFQGIISASDGKTYFALASHTTKHNGQFYSFDPETETITHIKDLGAWCGEDSLVGIANTQGKIHSNIYEVDEKLYMSTTSGDFVEDFPYRGGHFIAYDLNTGECIDLGRYPDVGENGLLTMMYEPVYKRLYAIHQRNETLIYYDLRSENIVTIGSIQDSRQPRDMISDEKGRVYGTSNPCGLIWCYDPATNKRHALITTIPADPDAPHPESGQNLWTQMRWDPVTERWYGVRRNDEYLFRLRLPQDMEAYRAETEGLAQIGYLPSDQMQPRIGSLALAIKDRTIYYTSIERTWDEYIERLEPVLAGTRGCYLMSYNIDTGEVTNHGPIFTDGRRRVSEIHSLAIGSDGNLHMTGAVFSKKGEDPANDWHYAVRSNDYIHMRFLVVDPDADFLHQD